MHMSFQTSKALIQPAEHHPHSLQVAQVIGVLCLEFSNLWSDFDHVDDIVYSLYGWLNTTPTACRLNTTPQLAGGLRDRCGFPGDATVALAGH
jgi:hypothetical protein